MIIAKKIKKGNGRIIYRKLNFLTANEKKFYLTGIVLSVLGIIRITLLLISEM